MKHDTYPDGMAFPGMEFDNTAGQRYHYGMTYRQWLIGQALAGACSIPGNPKHAADHAVMCADAVIERLKTEETP